MLPYCWLGVSSTNTKSPSSSISNSYLSLGSAFTCPSSSGKLSSQSYFKVEKVTLKSIAALSTELWASGAFISKWAPLKFYPRLKSPIINPIFYCRPSILGLWSKSSINLSMICLTPPRVAPLLSLVISLDDISNFFWVLTFLLPFHFQYVLFSFTFILYIASYISFSFNSSIFYWHVSVLWLFTPFTFSSFKFPNVFSLWSNENLDPGVNIAFFHFSLWLL